MQISIADEAGLTARVTLSGKLDIAGADVVALPLATLAGSKKNVLIDMSGVSFLASMGIRHLVFTSRALMRRGGRLLLLSPNETGRRRAGDCWRQRSHDHCPQRE